MYRRQQNEIRGKYCCPGLPIGFFYINTSIRLSPKTSVGIQEARPVPAAGEGEGARRRTGGRHHIHPNRARCPPLPPGSSGPQPGRCRQTARCRGRSSKAPERSGRPPPTSPLGTCQGSRSRRHPPSALLGSATRWQQRPGSGRRWGQRRGSGCQWRRECDSAVGEDGGAGDAIRRRFTKAEAVVFAGGGGGGGGSRRRRRRE